MSSRRTTLRQLIKANDIVVAPGAYDVVSALLIEQAGFPCIYLTGNGQGASALGLPDLGMITLSEMAERTRQTAQRTTLPLIVDADDGYGSLLNLQRAVQEFEFAGASAIQIEDQASPKKCGHELGRELVSIEEMSLRLRAAVSARRSQETLLIARTDARTTDGLDEAIRRSQAYVAAGADVIFVESPESEAELAEIAGSITAPKVANMVETGRSPYLSSRRLAKLGFEMAIYPVSTILGAAGGVRRVLRELAENGRADEHSPDNLTLHEYHELLSFYSFLQTESDLRSESVTVPGATSGEGSGA